MGAFKFYLQKTLKVLLENGQQIDLKPEQGAAIKSSVHNFTHWFWQKRYFMLFIKYSCELRRRC